MKEITGTAMNLHFNVIDEKVHANIEGIFVLSEPIYRFDATGQIIKERTTETMRFSTSVNGLKALVKDFLSWIELAENGIKHLDYKKEGD